MMVRYFIIVWESVELVLYVVEGRNIMCDNDNVSFGELMVV